MPGLDHREGVPHPKLALEVQGGPHSSQAPLNHDGNPVAQHICLLHAVCRQHNCPVAPVLLDHIPGEPARTHKTLRCLHRVNHQVPASHTEAYENRGQHYRPVAPVLADHITGEPAHTQNHIMLTHAAPRMLYRRNEKTQSGSSLCGASALSV